GIYAASTPTVCCSSCISLFFQAEDGIRDGLVTGVQTCALPICVGIIRRRIIPTPRSSDRGPIEACAPLTRRSPRHRPDTTVLGQIGRASCRERRTPPSVTELSPNRKSKQSRYRCVGARTLR